MTIKEAKELACESFGEAYGHIKDEKNIGVAANYIDAYVNSAINCHGFACRVEWAKERPDFKLVLYKKECTIGTVYAKEKKK